MPKGKKGVASNSANAVPDEMDNFEKEEGTNVNIKEVDDISREKPQKKGKGRAKKGATAVDHSNGQAGQNGVEELSQNDHDEVSDKISSKASSEDDKNSNQESENEAMDKEVEGKSDEDNTEEVSDKIDVPETNGEEIVAEDNETGETKVVAKKRGVKRGTKRTGRGKKASPETGAVEDQTEETENLNEVKEDKAVPIKRIGKAAKKAGRGRQAASSKEVEADEDQADENEEQSDTLPEEKDNSAKPQKATRGRGRKAASSKDEDQADENEKQSDTLPEEKDNSAKPQKAARGRGRQPASSAKAAEAKTKVQKGKKNVQELKEEAVKGGRGRKRKNPLAESDEEGIYKTLSAKELKEAKNVKVCLLKQQSIDDMALKLVESEEGKVQSAAGNSGKGRGRKRVSDGENTAGPSKKSKSTASKAAPKREKIPEVGALDLDNESTNAKGKSWNLKIATWNVNGIRAWIEKDGLSYLTHEDPDILCIQETKCSEDKIPPESNPLGYHCYWVAGDKEGYSGVGLMSKKKPLAVEYGIRKKVHDSEGRVITAEYEEYYLVSTYVPNAGRKLVRLDYRQQWDVDFRAYLKKLDKIKPVILCGDLNVAHNEIDLANPKTNKKNAGFTQEERDGFSSLLTEGFVDAFRHLYPTKKDAYTFWTYLANARAKNVGWRLDYFVLSERFIENLCDCVIRKDVMGSDHCPLVLFLHI